MAAALNDIVDSLLACVCEALETAERPTCHCYQVVGTPMWRPCCECSDCADCSAVSSGELVAWIENEYPVDRDLFPVNRIESCRRGPWAVAVAIQLSRCYPTVTENAQLPQPDDLDAAARAFHDDAETIRNALTCCTGLRLAWRSLGAEVDPEGGCSYLTARVTVGLD